MLFARTVRLSGVPFRFNAMVNRNFSASRIRNNIKHVKSLEGADDLSTRDAAADVKLAIELNKITRSELHSYVKLMFSFGVGVVVFGLGGGAYKLILHDGERDEKLDARFNKKVDEIKKELMEDIAEVKKEVSDIKKEIGDIKKDLGELNGSMNTLISIMKSRKE